MTLTPRGQRQAALDRRPAFRWKLSGTQRRPPGDGLVSTQARLWPTCTAQSHVDKTSLKPRSAMHTIGDCVCVCVCGTRHDSARLNQEPSERGSPSSSKKDPGGGVASTKGSDQLGISDFDALPTCRGLVLKVKWKGESGMKQVGWGLGQEDWKWTTSRANCLNSESRVRRHRRK